MCLTILLLEPDAGWPVRLLSFREEFLDRDADPPESWWPERPHVVGGRDREAGGTWFAVHRTESRVAAIHTSFTAKVAAARRRSRGEVTLQAVAGEPWAEGDLSCYDDFTLLAASVDGARWHEYRGSLVSRTLGPGVHVASVAGIGPDAPRPRQAHWTEVVTRHGLPALDSSGSPSRDWAGWLRRTGAAELTTDDPNSLYLRRPARDRVFGTRSVSAAAIRADAAVAFYVLDAAEGLSGASWRAAVRPEPAPASTPGP